jgi:PTH2 family peptidyl-tRNA hydrolase
MFRFKQVIVIRTDIKMGTGKKVAQGAHASILASEKAKKYASNSWSSWFNEGQRKIACKVRSKEELLAIKAKAERANLPCALVQDAGLTQLKPGTITALGVGPALESEIDPVTGDLKLL